MKIRSLESPPITIGNHTYIPLLISATPHQKVSDILVALQEFEQNHPELEVTSWNIEKHDFYYIDGLWVNHRPK